MHAHYDPWLVALSILTSIFASFTGLSLAARMRRSSAVARPTWLGLSALAMGGGIWSMHFIAMLAASVGVNVAYDAQLTIASLGMAVGLTGVGHWMVATFGRGPVPLITGGTAMGLGVAGMHYTGMDAMRMQAIIHYDGSLVALSVVIAIAAATAALWLSFSLTSLRGRLVSSLIMAAAVCGMHYVGMAAATFHAHHQDYSGQAAVPAPLLAISIGVATCAILILALLLAILDEVLERRMHGEAARLRQSEERFRSLIQNAADLIALADSSARLHYVSASAVRVLERPAGELVGSDLFSLVPPEQQGRLRMLFDEICAAPSRNVTAEFTMRRGATGWRECELVGTNLLDDPAVKGIVFNIRDISTRRENAILEHRIAERTMELSAANDRLRREVRERAEAQNSLKQAHAVLEQKVEERTQQLLHAKEAAEQASQAKSQFLASMSHELRTPLNAVIGYSEMLYEDAEAEHRTEQMADLAKIRSAGMHLLSLINDILDLSKIEAGRMDLAEEVIDLDALIAEVLATCRPLAEKNRNSLSLETNGPLGAISTDATRLRQCLLNLLGNAAKFTEAGAITLSVRRRSAEDGAWISFTVRDTGIGISADDLKKLFDRFAQVHPSTTGRYGGTGLGLAISQRIAGLMGGVVTVESTLGVGSSFTMTIPERSAEKAPVRMAAPVPPARNRGRALIIDDDPEARDLLARLLAREGYTPVMSDNAAAGIQLARAVDPDFIILDVLMPGLDGWEALQAIKSDSALRCCPVIMLTMMDERQKGIDLGADDFFVKPVHRDALIRALDRLRAGGARRNVLLVGSDQDRNNRVSHCLSQQGWTVDIAPTTVDAFGTITRQMPRMVVVDPPTPLSDGLDFAQSLVESWPDLTVAILAGADRRHLDEPAGPRGLLAVSGTGARPEPVKELDPPRDPGRSDETAGAARVAHA